VVEMGLGLSLGRIQRFCRGEMHIFHYVRGGDFL
jgi:hypothetical protein